jgi:hypothetical protein
MQESGQSLINIIQEPLILYNTFSKLMWLAKNERRECENKIVLSTCLVTLTKS